MRRALVAMIAMAVSIAGCGGGEEAPPPSGPFLVVLGVAQDGGLPHVGCPRPRCEAARNDPSLRRRPACLGLVAEGRVYLLDATPELPSQAADLAPFRGEPSVRGPVDGVFVTHAHIGHYLGLAHLGREAAGARGVPVWGTESVRGYLGSNGPWDLLVRLGNVELRGLEEGVDLPGGVRVEAIPVPHRQEYSDTVALVVKGPGGSVLYLPDIDSWEEWEAGLEETLAAVDRAYLDGTFFSGDELPGRDLSKIPHPRVKGTLARLAGLPETERAKVRFLHLNHSNPLHDEGSPERAEVEAAGMAVAREGERFFLGR